MKESGQRAPKLDRAKGHRFGLMAACTKDGGLATKLTAMVDSSMLTVTSTMESGKTTRHMALEFIAISTELNTRANGTMISNMAMELKLGPTAQDIKVNMLTARSKARVYSPGLTEVLIKGLSRRTIYKGRVSIIGQMAESTKAHG